MLKTKITPDIFFLGFNDRRTHLFENLWPVPQGVSYNSYLILDEKIALIDTVERQYIDDYLDAIDDLTGGKPVDYLIVNHMEPDHSGALRAVMTKYPGMVLVGNKKTFGLVKSFYGSQGQFLEVNDDDTLSLGNNTLLFRTIPMVHWPETMVTYVVNSKVLFSGDAFGSFGTLDGAIFDDEINLAFYEGEAMRYFTNIVGKFCVHTQKALTKLGDLDIKVLAATHGPVWRTNLPWILDRYRKWSSYETDKGVVIAYGSMYGNTQKMAEVVARRLAEKSIRDIRVYDASKTHASYIINDIFRYSGFIAGSCAYNNSIFPAMESLISMVGQMGLKNHLLGIFGNFSWSGGGVKGLMAFADDVKWPLVCQPVEARGAVTREVREELENLADAMALRVHSGPVIT